MTIPKYRVWDIENKKMLTGDDVLFQWETMEAKEMESIKKRFRFDMREEFIKNLQRKFVFMQFTGHLDKAEKEIYMDDIVANHWYDVNNNFIGRLWVVKYGMHSINNLDYYSNSGEGFYYDAQNGIDDDTYNIANLPYDEDKGIEIIGNVHENPKFSEKLKC